MPPHFLVAPLQHLQCLKWTLRQWTHLQLHQVCHLCRLCQRWILHLPLMPQHSLVAPLRHLQCQKWTLHQWMHHLLLLVCRQCPLCLKHHLQWMVLHCSVAHHLHPLCPKWKQNLRLMLPHCLAVVQHCLVHLLKNRLKKQRRFLLCRPHLLLTQFLALRTILSENKLVLSFEAVPKLMKSSAINSKVPCTRLKSRH